MILLKKRCGSNMDGKSKVLLDGTIIAGGTVATGTIEVVQKIVTNIPPVMDILQFGIASATFILLFMRILIAIQEYRIKKQKISKE